MTEPESYIPLAHRVATARSALSSAALARGLEPAIGDQAVTELLTDLRHFCAGRRIDFDDCNRSAERHFANDISGGLS